MNDRSLNRTVDSEDDEDATSWDGGDDDEEEPDQMELDDDEDDAAEDSSEEEEESHSLMVTLRYRKGASDGAAATEQNAPMENGVDHDFTAATGAPSVGTSAPQQPGLTPAPETSAPVPTPAATTNGISTPVISVAQQHPTGNPEVLPKLDGFVSVPTPPEEAPKPQAPVEVPTSTFDAPPLQQPAPTPTASL
jgi:hypothetical protein